MNNEEKILSTLLENSKTLAKVDERTKHMADKQLVNDRITADNTRRIRDLELKPAKKWGLLISSIITGIVGAIGLVVGYFFKQQ